MEVQVTWKAPTCFEGRSLRSGARVTMDVQPEAGGTGLGPSPMETVLMALAGCTGIDVVHTLAKMRAPLAGLVIDVAADRAPDHPKVFTAIRLRYVAWGLGLQRAQVERAVRLSQEKYCSVAAMLRATATLDLEVVVGDRPPQADAAS